VTCGELAFADVMFPGSLLDAFGSSDLTILQLTGRS